MLDDDRDNVGVKMKVVEKICPVEQMVVYKLTWIVNNKGKSALFGKKIDAETMMEELRVAAQLLDVHVELFLKTEVVL